MSITNTLWYILIHLKLIIQKYSSSSSSFFSKGNQHFLNKLANWALWRIIFDRMWTEYTLYYLTAQCTKTFQQYHFRSTTQKINFYGLSVWWRTDWSSYTRFQLLELIHLGLKWREKEMNETNGRTIIDKSIHTHYLFTVLQGRQYINPNLYHKLFYPIFIKYLKQYDNTQGLIEILEIMSERLVKK